MRRARLLLAVAAAALASGCLGGPLTGEPVPAFQVVTSDGLLVNETTYLGRFVILDLMATWCAPCKLEVAHLREVQERHPDVVILSVGVDPQETLVEHEAFREKYGAEWPYAIDRDGKVKAAMGMRIIPKLVVIDPEGVVVLEREGEVLPAAITRVIDPSSAPPAGATWLAVGAALVAGFLAPFNPYRRLHRDAGTGGPTLAALGVLAALAVVAWPFAGLASTRATYGSLFVGALTLGAAAWWARARRKARVPTQGSALQAAGDRGYEMAPHFAAALVLALSGAGAAGFFAPLAAFFAGAAGGSYARPRVPALNAEAAGVAGLVLVGTGLLAFGSRVLFV